MKFVCRLLAMLLMSCFVASCLSTIRATGVASPYVGRDGIFRYGNFCGPGFPVREGNPSSDNIMTAVRTQPIDALDEACKVHDLCYLRFGILGQCDAALSEMSERRANYEGWTQECRALATEISFAVSLRATARPRDFLTHVAIAPLQVLVGVPYVVGRTAGAMITAQNGQNTWPKEGTCHGASIEAYYGADALSRARLISEGRSDFTYSELENYARTFDMRRFLSGGW